MGFEGNSPQLYVVDVDGMKIQYVQKHLPDRMALADLLQRAKGWGGSMKELSLESGVNPSTLSRICNGKITRPVSYEVLDSIYRHRAKDASFTFQDLLLANGMEPIEQEGDEDSTATPLPETHESPLERETMRRQVKNIVAFALRDRGKQLSVIPASFERRRYEAPFNISLPFDFNISILKEKNWPLSPRYFVLIDTVTAGSRDSDVIKSHFLIDSWEPAFLNGTKTTFVFTDELVFTEFFYRYRGAPLKNTFTLLLVDLKKKAVVGVEKDIHGKDIQTSILSLPKKEGGGFFSYIDEEYYR